MYQYRIFVALGIAVAIAACSAASGGGGSVAPPVGTSTIAPQSNSTVNFSVVVPRNGTSPQKIGSPNYISPSTQSLTISVASPNTPTATRSANCSANVCSISIEAPTGYDSFTIQLFDGANGSGNLLAAGSVWQTILIGTANSVNVTFIGVAKKVTLAASPNSLPYGAASSSNITVAEIDADGNTIVGPGAYAAPISLSLSGAAGVATLTPTDVTQPGETVALLYTGQASTGMTITATAPNVLPVTIAFGITGGPSPSPTPVATATATPIPTATPMPTPTPSPTVAPTPTPTPTPTPIPTASASPVPTATPIPTATPNSAIVISPYSLNFFNTGAAYAQTFTVGENGFSGTYTETDTCHPSSGTIATLSPTSAGGPNAIFTVTPVNAGTCTITITDGIGNTAAVSIGVTLSQGVIN